MGDVVVEILGWILHRFANERAGREVHDRIRPELGQDRQRSLPILQIAFDKFCPRIERGTMAFTQVIENSNLVVFVKKQFRADAADVTSASDDKNLHPAKVAKERR